MEVQRLSWWVEWPAGIVRCGVVFLVAATVIAVLLRYPEVLRQSGRDASRNSSLSFADRDVAGGNGLVVDQDAVYAARGIIPEDETFKVAVDPGFQGGSAETVPYVDSYYRYFLMPRRTAEDPQWVICYACDVGSYGSQAQVVWEGDDDVSIVRIGE